MKTVLAFCFFGLAPGFLFAQVVDTAAVHKAVDSLIQISRSLTGKRDFGEALNVNATAENVALNKLGRESAAYGSCCFNRGRVLKIMGNYSEAEKWYLESKAVQEKVMGKEHPDYAWTLNNLANLYMSLGNYEKAEHLHIEAKAIREKVLRKDHPDYATSLANLTLLYYGVGKYEKAKAFCIEAKAIREKVLGKEHPDYASILDIMANLYYALGDYEKAELLYFEAKTIREKALGKEHPEYANSLYNLATLYHIMSNYEKAEPLYLEAKAIWEKVLGKEHPNYAASLNNLAGLYSSLGNFDKVEALYLEAIAILEKIRGKKHPDYAKCLNNLGILYEEMGNYKKAEHFYLEAKAIREEVLGKEHPDYAEGLNDIATLYYKLGSNEKAKAFSIESKTIKEKVLGKEHPAYARSLNLLANLYYDLDNFEMAEPLYLESKSIQEKVLGKESPDYARSLNNLAELYRHLGDNEKALPLRIEHAQLTQTYIIRAMHHLSERELNRYIYTFSKGQDKMFSLVQLSRVKKSLQTSLNNTLFHKGFLLTATSHIRQLATRDTAAARLNNLLKSYHRRLAAEYAKPIAERKNIAELEEKANTTEKELVRTVAGYGDAIRQVDWQEVQAALKPGEAAVEFVHYRYYTPDPTDSTMYAALVLRPGDTSPVFIPLFEERQLASLLPKTNDQDRIDAFYHSAAGQALHGLIWEPLDSLLQGVSAVYCSPSGLLHRINLGALPVSETQIFADRHQLVTLGSTRQLVVGGGTDRYAQNAVLFGGIQYDYKSASAPGGNTRGMTVDSSDLSVAVLAKTDLPFPYDTTLRGAAGARAWTPLAATKTEVRNISSLLQKDGFQTITHTAAAATEEAFKQLGHETSGSPRILHLATHGYFFPDPKEAPQTTFGNEDRLVFRASEHPMIRSGLILAGANETWTSGKPPADREDGILTAYEISQMNLRNTELVVLSACETGLGQIEGNEGVYGLQRAFKIAGVKYLIMSLWQVSDAATGELMTEFYRQYLEKKLPVPAAFRAAQATMRGRYPESPWAWAGFVLVE